MTSRFVLAMLIAVTVTTLLPAEASAQTQNTRLVAEIKNFPTIIIPDLNTINNFTNPDQAVDEAPQIDPTEQNKAVLENYLAKKGSPLAPYAEYILTHENWKLVLAISNGESTMCKRQLYNNCWGVGGAWNLRRYATFAEGFTDVNRLLTDKYVANGQDTPKEIVRKYVGNYSPSWVRAVSQTLDQLNQLPLVN